MLRVLKNLWNFRRDGVSLSKNCCFLASWCGQLTFSGNLLSVQCVTEESRDEGGATGESPVEGYEDDEGTGASLL